MTNQSSPVPLDDLPSTVIRPTRGWKALNLRELSAYRELLYFLTWRDIKVRYKQTVLGAAWAIIQPLMMMVVFTVFFGKIAGFDEGLGGNYALLTFAALTPWTFFSNGLTMSSNSLVGSAELIKKVYFPRLAIPISSVLSGAVDFILVLLVLFGLMAYFGVAPTANILLLPFFLLLAFVTALGAGLWFSAMNVQFRDVRYTIPFLTQFWLFASPVAYPLSEVPESWRLLYHLNPMVGVIEGFQWSLVGHGAPGVGMAISVLTALALLVSGAFYFRRMERSFADVV